MHGCLTTALKKFRKSAVTVILHLCKRRDAGEWKEFVVSFERKLENKFVPPTVSNTFVLDGLGGLGGRAKQMERQRVRRIISPAHGRMCRQGVLGDHAVAQRARGPFHVQRGN